MLLNFGQRRIDLSTPKIMGVVNMTPDSFSDGGKIQSLSDALKISLNMERNGAAIIDIGGESTRPGSHEVSSEIQISRVIPLIKALRESSDVIISIDTGNPEVMNAAVESGADLINDVYALTKEGAMQVAIDSGKIICLMHMQNLPHDMQDAPSYKKLPEDILSFFKDRIDACIAAGLSKDKLIIDPGFGFGKDMHHNLLLLQKLSSFKQFDIPICVGISRKKLIGDIIGKPLNKRLIGGLSAGIFAAMHGANIIRTHDVMETKEALDVLNAIQGKYKE